MRTITRWFGFVVASATLATSTIAQVPAPKSEGTAFGLSIAGTLAPIAVDLGLGSGVLAAFGVIVGPSLGHFYAGNARRGALGSLGRAGLAVLTVGVGVGCAMSDCDTDGAAQVLGAAVAATATWIVVDIAQAGRSARRYNATHGVGPVTWRPPGTVRTPSQGSTCVALCPR